MLCLHALDRATVLTQKPALEDGVLIRFSLIYKQGKQWREDFTLTSSYEEAAHDCVAKVMALEPPARGSFGMPHHCIPQWR
jgi:hypothetical protein